MKKKKIFVLALVMLLIGVILVLGYRSYSQRTTSFSQNFSSQNECEEKTGKVCSFQPCGDVSNEKKSEEVCGKDFFKKSWVSTTNPLLIVGSTATVRGYIEEENITTDAPVDGGAYLRLRTGNWTTKVIYNPGDAECINPLSQSFNLKSLEKVEVYGKVISDNTISTCESKDFYIKVVDAI